MDGRDDKEKEEGKEEEKEKNRGRGKGEILKGSVENKFTRNGKEKGLKRLEKRKIEGEIEREMEGREKKRLKGEELREPEDVLKDRFIQLLIRAVRSEAYISWVDTP